jgi:hypothetical protein
MTSSDSPDSDAVYKVPKRLVLPCLVVVRDYIDTLIADVEGGGDDVDVVYRIIAADRLSKPPVLCSCDHPGFFATLLPSEVIERVAPLLAGLLRGRGR